MKGHLVIIYPFQHLKEVSHPRNKIISVSKSQVEAHFQRLYVFLPVAVFPAVPSAPRSFRIQQRHLDSIYVDWDLPAEPNGIITGYSLKYQTGTPYLIHSQIPLEIFLSSGYTGYTFKA